MTAGFANNNKSEPILPYKKRKNKLDNHELGIIRSVASVVKYFHDDKDRCHDVCLRNEKQMNSNYARVLLWATMISSAKKAINFYDIQTVLDERRNEDFRVELARILNENLEEFTIDLLQSMVEGHVDLFFDNGLYRNQNGL